MKRIVIFLLWVVSLSIEVYGQSTPTRIPNKRKNSNTSPQLSNSGNKMGRSNPAELPKPRPDTKQPLPKRYVPTPPYTPPSKPKPIRLGYHKGNHLLNIGVGLSSYYYGNPVGASYEVGVDKDISVGVQLDYNSGNYGDYYYNNSRWRYTATYIGVRGSYHVNRILKLNSEKVDLYAGLGLGYRSFHWRDPNYGYSYNYDYSSGLALNYYIGGKYYFTSKVGAFLELGYTGLSSSRVGLSVKF